MRYLVGIDNGGTFSKAAVFDEDGSQIAAASVPTTTITPKPGYTERDMTQLWEVNVLAVRTAIEKSGICPSDIAGVSFSGHGKGLYMMKGDGTPAYNGIISTDTRAWEYVERWETRYSKDPVRRSLPVSLSACWHGSGTTIRRCSGM